MLWLNLCHLMTLTPVKLQWNSEMDLTEYHVTKTLDETISALRHQPIDLLNRNDQDGERRYLENAYKSYRRTLLDIIACFSNKAGSAEPARVLEIGAYLGVVSLSLASLGLRVSALDLPEFANNPRLRRRLGDAGVELTGVNLRDYKLPYTDGQFDLVIMCETLEHLNFNPLPVIAEINRVIKNSGHLYLALPNLASLPHRFNLLLGRSIHDPVGDFVRQLSDKDNMIVGLHWREYTRSELLELLSLSGFSCQWHNYEMPTKSLPVARMLYRLIPSLRPAQSLLARKITDLGIDFHFTDASKVL